MSMGSIKWVYKKDFFSFWFSVKKKSCVKSKTNEVSMKLGWEKVMGCFNDPIVVLKQTPINIAAHASRP